MMMQFPEDLKQGPLHEVIISVQILRDPEALRDDRLVLTYVNNAGKMKTDVSIILKGVEEIDWFFSRHWKPNDLSTGKIPH